MKKEFAVFLDVDGVINSLQHLESSGKPQFSRQATKTYCNNYPIWVPDYMPDLVQAIHKVADISWLTTWRGDANVYIAPLVGLPELPVLDDGTGSRYVGWKFGIAADAAKAITNSGQRVFWIEDFSRHYGPVSSMSSDITYVDTDADNEGVLLPQHLPQPLLDAVVAAGYDGPTHIPAPTRIPSSRLMEEWWGE